MRASISDTVALDIKTNTSRSVINSPARTEIEAAYQTNAISYQRALATNDSNAVSNSSSIDLQQATSTTSLNLPITPSPTINNEPSNSNNNIESRAVVTSLFLAGALSVLFLTTLVAEIGRRMFIRFRARSNANHQQGPNNNELDDMELGYTETDDVQAQLIMQPHQSQTIETGTVSAIGEEDETALASLSPLTTNPSHPYTLQHLASQQSQQIMRRDLVGEDETEQTALISPSSLTTSPTFPRATQYFASAEHSHTV